MLSATAIIALLAHYGYAILLPISVLEGPLVSIVGGLLVSQGVLEAHIVFLILLLGDIVGDTIYYNLGKYGGRRLAHRWGKYLGASEEKLESLEKKFHSHDWKLIFFAKTQAIGGAILFAAGMAHIPYKRFILLNIVGSIPKIILFEATGYYFGASITQEGNPFLSYTGFGSLVLALLLVGIYFLFRARVKQNEKDYIS